MDGFRPHVFLHSVWKTGSHIRAGAIGFYEPEDKTWESTSVRNWFPFRDGLPRGLRFPVVGMSSLLACLIASSWLLN